MFVVLYLFLVDCCFVSGLVVTGCCRWFGLVFGVLLCLLVWFACYVWWFDYLVVLALLWFGLLCLRLRWVAVSLVYCYWFGLR